MISILIGALFLGMGRVLKNIVVHISLRVVFFLLVYFMSEDDFSLNEVEKKLEAIVKGEAGQVSS